MTAKPPTLWTDRRTGGDHDWLVPPAPGAGAQPFRPPAEPAPPPPRSRRGPLLTLAAILVGFAVVGGAGIIEAIFGGEDRDPVTALSATGGRTPDTRINEIYARVSAGVVSVQVLRGDRRASGTGFVVTSDGTLVTNAHVVGRAREAQVRFDDGDRPVRAQVVGTDPSSDLAVLRVDPGQVRRLQPLPLADSDAVEVGDTAIAIGYPLGLDRTATAGIVSGLRREIPAPNGFRIEEVIQTDAPINPGNSGGPLLDAHGRVIGVNSQIAASRGGGNVGIGFAVPSNTVRNVVPQLLAGRTIRRAYLGVSTSPSTSGGGAVVREVTRGGPAERAGLRAASAPNGSDGDVILSIEGRSVDDPDDVASAIQSRQPGEQVDIVVRRGGRRVTVEVRLGRRPQRTP